ncbi:MerR family transcriptional regulator [Candidatus Cloacimonadaceae bacterium]
MSKYYYTIGEVSNLLGVKPHVIRYWESEFPILKPKKSSGRIRKFSQEHIHLLKKIQDLLYNQRFTIEGARQKLKQERDSIATIKQDAEPAIKPKSVQQLGPEQLKMLQSLRSELQKIKELCKQWK